MSDSKITKKFNMMLDHIDMCTIVEEGIKAVFGYSMLSGLKVAEVDEQSLPDGFVFDITIEPEASDEEKAQAVARAQAGDRLQNAVAKANAVGQAQADAT